MGPKRQLSRKISESTGLNMPAFCGKYLFTNYKAFQYRIRVGRCNPNEIIFISWFLGESVETLFGKPFTELMMGQGETEVSKKALDLFNHAPKGEKKRLMKLLGAGFPLGVSPPKIGAGVSTEKYDGSGVPPLLSDEAGLVALPSAHTYRKVTLKAAAAMAPEFSQDEYKALEKKAQKKAPIPPTTVEDMTPKKSFDPFDAFEDFKITR